MDLVLIFPSTLVVVEILPLDKILHVTISLALANDAFNNFMSRVISLLFELKTLDIFVGEAGISELELVYFVTLYVVANLLEALVTLQELLCLIGVVEMRKSFPFDMETLPKASQARNT